MDFIFNIVERYTPREFLAKRYRVEIVKNRQTKMIIDQDSGKDSYGFHLGEAEAEVERWQKFLKGEINVRLV